MLKGKISPSMMCADFLELKQCIRDLETAGVEYLHFDIMDGVFVPNLMLCNEIMKQIRAVTDIPFDVHFMITQPEYKTGWFDLRPGDIGCVHYEATPHVQRALQAVKATGATAAVALNPATPISALDWLVDDVGMVLLMTVNPGYAGQKLIPQTLKKISDTRAYLDARRRQDMILEVDGNVSFDNARLMRAAGADLFVAGTSSIFTKGMTVADAAAKLREAIK
ncbi:MAG: ribulose-phosphate 3-epimerase [Firmicutes bacterium]|nr:ribulose-phosphate 3-epimerase [Bacillota bacterium]